MMEAGLCAAWRTPINEIRQMLVDGFASEDYTLGALKTYITGGRSLQSLFGLDSDIQRSPYTRTEQLRNGNLRETKSASSFASLQAMAGLDNRPPDNLNELLAAGLDMGVDDVF